ncbi:MAG TPA: 1-deoxy-D-xylulose-5-phosphate synthase [Telluria sp.]|jgi:hypothetical protein
MKASQLTRGLARRLMYVENKNGLIDGAAARIGWVTFSKTGRTVRYRGLSLMAIGGRGIAGNFMDVETREEYWVTGVKARGTNAHFPNVAILVDDDAVEAYAHRRAAAK